MKTLNPSFPASGFRAVEQEEQPTKAQIEQAAKAICKEWGYEWEGDPEFSDDVAPDDDDYLEDRPSKMLFRRAAEAALRSVMVRFDGENDG